MKRFLLLAGVAVSAVLATTLSAQTVRKQSTNRNTSMHSGVSASRSNSYGTNRNIGSNGRTRIIAFRGYWNLNDRGKDNASTPYNSIASIREAGCSGFYGSSFAVNMTSDGGLLVCHGPKILKTEDVQKSPFNYTRNQRLSNGENVPTLEEYLAAGKNAGVHMYMEIKPHRNSGDGNFPELDAVSRVVNNMHVSGMLTIMSGNIEICRQAARRFSNVNVEYMRGDKTPEEVHSLGIDGISYNYNVYKSHEDYVGRAHRLGMVVNVWTLDDEEDIRNMIELGADEIMSNRPSAAQQISNRIKRGAGTSGSGYNSSRNDYGTTRNNSNSGHNSSGNRRY